VRRENKMAMLHRETNRVKWVGVRPAHDGTQVTVDSFTSAGAAILYTVTAGKTLFLCHFTLECSSGAVVSGADFWVRNGADVIQYYLLRQRLAISRETIISPSFWPPIEIPAGWDIVMGVGVATTTEYAFIHGWEE
jgi:hypothetical protein